MRTSECAGMPRKYVSMAPGFGIIYESTGWSSPEPNWYIYHSDHLGSSAFLTDAAGDPTQHLQYMPFGENFIEQRSITSYYTPYTFSAKERDTETGYSYFGARYYDADISVWLSVDPMADKAPGWTPYRYCWQNPSNITDPFGLFEDDYYINLDGTIYVERTDDGFDRFFIRENSDGPPNSGQLIAQYDKNDAGLIHLKEGLSYSSETTCFGFSVKKANTDRLYIKGDALAALIGSIAYSNVTDLMVTGFSKRNGGSAAPSKTHFFGIVGDLRYLRKDQTGGSVLLGSKDLDEDRQNSLNEAIYLYGWKKLVSENYTSPTTKKTTRLNRAIHYSKSRHNDHLHIGEFYPNTITILPTFIVKQ